MTSLAVGPSRASSRIHGVDIIRGLAIFFVMMNHVNMRLRLANVPYTDGLPDQLVSSLVWNSQYGVQMFFAVSGFLITSTALWRWGELSQISVRGFYTFRFARIGPLFLALLLVLSVLHALGAKYFVISPATGLLQAVWSALTFRINVLEARVGYLPPSWDVLWSLSVEEMFYLFFPVVCLIFARSRILIGLLLGFIVLGPFGRTIFAHNEIWREYSYLGSMDAIAIGCITAIINSRMKFSRSTLRIIGGAGILILVFILGFSIQAGELGLDRAGLDMSLLAIGTCLTILAATQSNWQSPTYLKPLLKIGERSYEIYLVHMFAILILFQVFIGLGKPLSLVPIFFISAVLISGFFGDVVARWYSEPFNSFLRNRYAEKSTGRRA